MKPKLITPPEGDPVSLDETKAHLRVFYADDDAYISSLIKAATAYLDGYQGILNRCIMPQSWQVAHCHFSREMGLLFTDATAATVSYYDAYGDMQPIDAANFRVYPDCVRFTSGFVFPLLQIGREDRVFITSTHGYDIVPESLKLAIKILVAHWYRNREPVTMSGTPANIPYTINALIAPHRWAF